MDDCPPSGVWFFDVFTCDPNLCPDAEGACRDPLTRECTMTPQADCAGSHEWQGPGASCVPNPCPQSVPAEPSTWGWIKQTYRQP